MSTPMKTQTKAPSPVRPAFTPARTGLLQRKCACGGSPGVDGECEACRNKRLSLQRQTISAAGSATAPPIVHEVLSSPGQPLDAGTRAFMEPRFGHDFSQVRVHTDARAAESARAVNALAYTVGRDLVFGARQHAPATNEGRLLIAHELTHVLQQQGRRGTELLSVGPATGPQEEEANTTAARVLESSRTPEPLSVTKTSGPTTAQRLLINIGIGVGLGWEAYKAYKCLSPLYEPCKNATFDRFIPWYYSRTHAPVPSRVWDAFGHCLMACEGTKKCGATVTAMVGKAREFGREYLFGGPHDSYEQDTNNQTLGRSFGGGSRDCYDACSEASLKTSGGLDLSAPPSELWDPSPPPDGTYYPDPAAPTHR